MNIRNRPLISHTKLFGCLVSMARIIVLLHFLKLIYPIKRSTALTIYSFGCHKDKIHRATEERQNYDKRIPGQLLTSQVNLIYTVASFNKRYLMTLIH